MTFFDTSSDYRTVTANPHSGSDWVRAAAERLPLSPAREVIRADAEDKLDDFTGWCGRSWVASIADTTFELRRAIDALEKGGAYGSLSKVKDQARELLRLLGEE